MKVFAVYVDDRPGVLNRVTSLLRRRGYNIDSLTVGRTDNPGVSRMTIVLDLDTVATHLVEANLYKLVNVLRVEEITGERPILRDLALIKVAADSERRPQVMQVAEVFRARVVDVSPESLIYEITGTEDKIQGLVEVLRPFGIIEMVRTGQVAIVRGPDAIARDPSFVHARVPTNGED